jgi:DNA polymerase
MSALPLFDAARPDAAAPAGALHPEGDPSGSRLPPAVDPGEALASLGQACDGCRRCHLGQTRLNVVVSRGNPRARLMVVGEGPGAQEDEQGRPFVGRSGQLLDRMLESVGIHSNRDAYVCNIVKCRPPENRKPTALEMAACRPWLEQQIALVDPAVILLAGGTAVEGLLGIKGGITKLRGQWRRGEGGSLEGRWLMPILHPSYLLRNASKERGSPKWLTWHDLQDVKRRLAQLPVPL